MKKYFLKFSLILISSIFFCCDRVENRFLYIKNDSKSPIVCLITKKELNLIKNDSRFLAVELGANEEGSLNPVKPSWERFMEESDNQKLRFYILSQDSITKNGLESVLNNNVYIKKNYLTIEELEKINFHITYK